MTETRTHTDASSDFSHRYVHGEQHKLGVLLVNLGSPEAPTASAVRRYLAQFLADRRVVDINRPLWWLLLHGVILRTRPARAAAAYKKIWTPQGSPLIDISRRQQAALREVLARRFHVPVVVELAMTYGKPAIDTALANLRRQGARRLLILPLYPQYSATTTGAVYDQVSRCFQQWRHIPEHRFVTHYHDTPSYIEALAASIRQHWQRHGRGQRLLFSFHGIPQRYADQGDPYPDQCRATAKKVAATLQLADSEWQLVFQSRFGKEPWLHPYCDATLQKLPGEGVKKVDILCPGFAADCLETLEEINIANRQLFLDAGGERFEYIPCLNDSTEHIRALEEVICTHLFGWPETLPGWDKGAVHDEGEADEAANNEQADASRPA